MIFRIGIPMGIPMGIPIRIPREISMGIPTGSSHGKAHGNSYWDLPGKLPWEIPWDIPLNFLWEFQWDFRWEFPWDSPLEYSPGGRWNSQGRPHFRQFCVGFEEKILGVGSTPNLDFHRWASLESMLLGGGRANPWFGVHPKCRFSQVGPI